MLKKVLKHVQQGTLWKVVSIKNLAKAFKYSRAYIYYRNTVNIIRYGPAAPRCNETIRINPQNITLVLPDAIKQLFGVSDRREALGKVIKSSWPTEQAEPIAEVTRIRSKLEFCFEHWIKVVPWGETGAYEYLEEEIKERGQVDGCTNIDDIIKRYENLDKIFDQVKREGRLRTREEINPNNYWEGYESMVHIGPTGELYLEWGGIHRLAIACILKIPLPARIGCVHLNAITYLNQLRRNGQ